MKAQILSVRFEHKLDDSPDSSYLGDFTSDQGSGWYVERESGILRDSNGSALAEIYSNYSRHEYEYTTGFQHPSSWDSISDNAVHGAYLHVRYRNNGRKVRRVKNGFDQYKIDGWKTAQTRAEKIRVIEIFYCCDDAERLERLQQGDWSYLGIYATAEIKLANDTIQTIRSGGLWGIESDSGKDYLESVEQDELKDLSNSLQDLGFSKRAITKAFADVDHVEV